MKFNKLMMAALFVGALSFSFASCDKKGNDPVQPEQQDTVPSEDPEEDPEEETDEMPDLDKPESGILRIVLEIPAGTECNGIALKGTFNGSDWSGENTYLGEEGAQTPVDGKIYKFAAVEGSTKYYSLDLPVGETPESMQFKVCLIYANDGSWQGQAAAATIHECNWSSVAPSVSGGQFVFSADANPSGQLLYINTGKWQMSECVEKVNYHIVCAMPACGLGTPEIIGGFDDWTGTAMTAVAGKENTYEATIAATEGVTYKFREAGTWDNEILVYDAATDAWGGMGNIELGTETEVTLDFSDAATYKWTNCAE